MTILLFVILYSLFMVFPAPVFAGEMANQFTISLYVNPQTSIASKALVVKDTEIRLVTDSSGNPLCQIHNGTDWQTAVTSSTALTTGSWAHVTCTYNKSNIYIYINGVQTGTGAQTAAVNDAATNFLVGQDDSSTYGNFIGTTDQVQIYNYARTAKQVVSDMGGGAPAVIAGEAKQSGPIAYWDFDEGVDNTCSGGTNDTCNSGSAGATLDGANSGFASPATSTSGWTQSGKFGKALNFDNTDDVVTVTANTAINNLTTRTLSAWIYPRTSGEGTYGRIFAKEDAGSTAGWVLSMGASNNKIAFSEYFGSFGRWDSPANSITVNQWNHVVVTFDSSSNSNDPLIYINGKSVTVTEINTPSTGSRSDDSSYNLLMGNRSSGDRTFDGLIDEPKIYNYALTADEVKLDYNRGSSLVLGSLSDNSSYQTQAANQEYCVPGDTSSTCAAPVGRWDFEEGTGTSVRDTSGNANNGTWNGTGSPHWTTGKIGKAGKFNGSNDYVGKNNASWGTTGLSNQVTFSAWIKPSVIDTNFGHIIATYSSLYARLYVYNGAVYFDTPGLTDTQTIASNVLTANKWTYVTATYDGSNKYIYINGVLKANEPATGTLSHGTHFYVGARSGPQEYFSGVIDEVRIFNYARSAAQVAWDYNRGAPVGHWDFDECQGTSLGDLSGNGNTGTITIGASGTQTAVGTCTGSANTAWKDGATGKINYSLDFDGTDDYVSMGDPSSGLFDFGTSTDFSISGWFKRASGLSGSEALVTKRDRASLSNPGYEVGLRVTGNLYARITDGTTEVLTADDGSSKADDTWHHFTVTFNRSGNVTRYIDGVPYGAAISESSTGTVSNSITLKVGSSTSGASETNIPFNGQIDDARIYNYALTATQVKLLYNNGAVNFGPSTGAP